MTTLLEGLGMGGFLLGLFNLYLAFSKHKKDKPIILIEKKDYLKHRKHWDMDPKEYSRKALGGKFNGEVLNLEVREIILDITNKGNKKAQIKSVHPIFQKDNLSFSPKMINFHTKDIFSRESEEVHLFFEISSEEIEKLDKFSQHELILIFDFVHKKMIKKFLLNKLIKFK